MNPQLLKEYRRVRDVQAQHVARNERDQHLAVYALRIARVRVAFRAAESDGLVKLNTEPEIDVYDDSYVDTWTDVSTAKREQIKKELHERIECEGVWILVGYYRLSEDDPWESTDSVGGFIGDDWKDSGYDVDIMVSTLDALRSAQCKQAQHDYVPPADVPAGW